MAIQHNVKTRSSKRTILYEKPNYFLFVKRIIDIFISLLLVICLLPAFLVICYIIFRREGKPIFQREAIVGKNNEPFIMKTFRTKTVPSQVIRSLPPHPVPDTWENGVPNSFTIKTNSFPTITSTGNWLLKYKLHKLPLLFHVLKGNMSLVGPQAEVKEVAQYYNDYQKNRLKLKPGLTGYAQMNGYTNENHQKKISYDIYYIKYSSFTFDLKIMFNAVKNLLKIRT